MSVRNVSLALAAGFALAAGSVTAAPAAAAAPVYKACGESWSGKWTPRLDTPLFKLVVYTRSVDNGKRGRSCTIMTALASPPGRKMTLKLTGPVQKTESTSGSFVYIKVTADGAAKGGATFQYKNPAYPGGVRTVSRSF